MKSHHILIVKENQSSESFLLENINSFFYANGNMLNYEIAIIFNERGLKKVAWCLELELSCCI